MADTKTSGAGLRLNSDFRKINPLIDSDRGTEHVESVLNFLSFLVLDATDGSITLDYDQAHGLAFMLDTCQAALKIMRNGEVDHG